MRRRVDDHVNVDPIHYSEWLQGVWRKPGEVRPGLAISPVPELWRRHARQPWRVLFPDLDWPPPDADG